MPLSFLIKSLINEINNINIIFINKLYKDNSYKFKNTTQSYSKIVLEYLKNFYNGMRIFPYIKKSIILNVIDAISNIILNEIDILLKDNCILKTIPNNYIINFYLSLQTDEDIEITKFLIKSKQDIVHSLQIAKEWRAKTLETEWYFMDKIIDEELERRHIPNENIISIEMSNSLSYCK